MSQLTVAVVNYGMGNIGSVVSALTALGSHPIVADNKRTLCGANAIILPGVGAFGAAMHNLHRLDLIETLTELVREQQKPFLGICLGMQLLAQDSVELGYAMGLGWISAHVYEIEPSTNLQVPHVGWNRIQFNPNDPFFERIEQEAHFYFDHSFHLQCERNIVAAECNYGGVLVAAIHVGNIFATQFHPEKSQRNGLKLLRNFLNYVEANKC